MSEHGNARKNSGFRFPRGRVCGAFGTGFRRHVQELDFPPGAVRCSDNTDCLFSTRSSDPSGRGVDRRGLSTIMHARTAVSDFHGAGFAGRSCRVFGDMCRNWVFHPAPFSGPTTRIASSRRDLTIHRAAAWIAEGFHDLHFSARRAASRVQRGPLISDFGEKILWVSPSDPD